MYPAVFNQRFRKILVRVVRAGFASIRIKHAELPRPDIHIPQKEIRMLQGKAKPLPIQVLPPVHPLQFKRIPDQFQDNRRLFSRRADAQEPEPAGRPLEPVF